MSIVTEYTSYLADSLMRYHAIEINIDFGSPVKLVKYCVGWKMFIYFCREYILFLVWIIQAKVVSVTLLNPDGASQRTELSTNLAPGNANF